MQRYIDKSAFTNREKQTFSDFHILRRSKEIFKHLLDVSGKNYEYKRLVSCF